MADIIVQDGERTIAHIVNPTGEDVKYEVYYAPEGAASCGLRDMYPMRRGGVTLLLTTQNTPIILDLPGVYAFNRITQAASDISYRTTGKVQPYSGVVVRDFTG